MLSVRDSSDTPGGVKQPMQITSRTVRPSFTDLRPTTTRAKSTELLGHFVDACLAATLVLAPLFMGGRGAVGQFAFVLLPSLAAVGWCARQTLLNEAKWRWSGAEWLLALGATLLILQLVPWPPSLLAKISPVYELLPLWNRNASNPAILGQWATISLTPEFTRGALTIYLAYALLFLVLTQRIARVEDVEKVLSTIAFAAVLMAGIGLTQFFAGSEKFLGLYEHPSRSASEVVRGAFQNENHFAHFMSLGLGPLIWCLYRLRQDERTDSAGPGGTELELGNRLLSGVLHRSSLQPILLVGLLLVALAGLLTFSRGGVLTLAVALVTCVSVMRWKSLIDRRTAMILSLVAIVNLAAMLIFGYESLSIQLGTLFQAGSIQELLAGRLNLWRALCDGIAKFYLTGTGVGSHREVYRIFMEEASDLEYTHGESGYLPLLLETGICGLVLMLSGIVTSLRWCVTTLLLPTDKIAGNAREVRSRTMLIGCSCAILPALVSSVVHSVADFVWYIPACMALTIAQVACACRLFQLSRGLIDPPSSRSTRSSSDPASYLRLSQGHWIAGTVLVTLAICAMIQNRLGPALAAPSWNTYLKHSVVRAGVISLSPSQERDRQDAMEERLSAVLRRSPQDARAHLRIASVYLAKFDLIQRSSENALGLSEIRDAALASKFPTKAAQDAWLSVALGDSRQLLDKALLHCRRAVTLSPLQGLGYLRLAELSFLESPRSALKKAYVDQAILVRPNDGQVLFLRGKEAALVNDLENAFKYWKIAFHRDAAIRQQLIDTIADPMPAELFISHFEPDLAGLEQLFQKYRSQDRVEEAKLVANRFLTALRNDLATKPSAEAASRWCQAQNVYAWLGDGKQSLECQRRAVELVPLNFDNRRHLAKLLVQQNRLNEAIEQYEWCLRRQPDDPSLQQELVDTKVLSKQSPAAPVVAQQRGTNRN